MTEFVPVLQWFLSSLGAFNLIFLPIALNSFLFFHLDFPANSSAEMALKAGLTEPDSEAGL